MRLRQVPLCRLRKLVATFRRGGEAHAGRESEQPAEDAGKGDSHRSSCVCSGSMSQQSERHHGAPERFGEADSFVKCAADVGI
jgi:hypothetical protein